MFTLAQIREPPPVIPNPWNWLVFPLYPPGPHIRSMQVAWNCAIVYQQQLVLAITSQFLRAIFCWAVASAQGSREVELCISGPHYKSCGEDVARLWCVCVHMCTELWLIHSVTYFPGMSLSMFPALAPVLLLGLSRHSSTVFLRVQLTDTVLSRSDAQATSFVSRPHTVILSKLAAAQQMTVDYETTQLT